jgi:adenosyl cobinamide kinase/adenosyl cobinamide phosphate guanylyltransferase
MPHSFKDGLLNEEPQQNCHPKSPRVKRKNSGTLRSVINNKNYESSSSHYCEESPEIFCKKLVKNENFQSVTVSRESLFSNRHHKNSHGRVKKKQVIYGSKPKMMDELNKKHNYENESASVKTFKPNRGTQSFCQEINFPTKTENSGIQNAAYDELMNQIKQIAEINVSDEEMEQLFQQQVKELESQYTKAEQELVKAMQIYVDNEDKDILLYDQLQNMMGEYQQTIERIQNEKLFDAQADENIHSIQKTIEGHHVQLGDLITEKEKAEKMLQDKILEIEKELDSSLETQLNIQLLNK